MPTYPIGGRTAPQSPDSGTGDHLLAGIKQLLAFPLTFPLSLDRAGQDLAYGVSGQHPPGTSQVNDILGMIDQWAHKESGPPQSYTDQAVELAPAVATAPGLVMKALTVAPTVISDAINSPKLKAAVAQAGAAEAGSPYVVEPSHASASGVPSSAPKLDLTTDQAPFSVPSADAPQSLPAGTDPYQIEDVGPRTPGVPLSVPHRDGYSIEPVLDVAQKPSDVTNADEQTGKAPYDDSSDYGKRAEYLMYGLLVAAGVATAAGGYKLLREPTVPASDVAGKVYPGSARDDAVTTTTPFASAGGERGAVTGPGTLLATQFIDHMAPQRAALELAPEGPVRDDLTSRMNLLQSHSLDGMVNDFHKTGRMPGSDIKVEVPTSQLADAVKALPPEKQAAFRDLVTLNTRIDQSIANDYKPWGLSSTKTAQITYNDMLAKRSKIMVDHPEVIRLAEDYHDLYRQVPKYAEQMGAIDAATRSAFETANPNFAPQHRQYAQSWYETIFGRTGGTSNKVDTGFLDFDKRMDLTTESLNPGEAGDPFKAAQDYFDGLFRAANINKYRSDFADFITKQGVGRQGQRYARIYNSEPSDPETKAVPFYQGGEKKWLVVDDPMLYSSLMWRPREVFRTLAAINRMSATTITGNLNPLFLAKHIAFDTLQAPLMLPKGTDIGPLSAILKTLGAKRGLSSFDPTNLLVSPAGGMRKLWSDLSYSMWTGVSKDLASNGILTQTLGKPNVETLSTLIRNAFERSTASLAEQYGVMGGNRFAVLDNTKTTPEILSHLPGFTGIGSTIAHLPGVNLYNAVTDALREGARLQFMATNIERVPVWTKYSFQVGSGSKLRTIDVPWLEWQPKSQAQLLKTASQTKRLMGDAGEIGGDTTTGLGYGMQKLTSMVMYGNQSIQVTAQLARMFKDHPTRFISTVAAMGTAAYHAWTHALSQPGVKQQLDDMTPEQRSRVIPIAFNDKLYGFMGVFPEARPFMGAMVHGYMALHGMLPKGEYEGLGDMIQGAKNSIWDDYLPNMSGPLLPAAAIMRKRLTANSLTPQDPAHNEVADANDPDYKASWSAWLDNAVTNMTGTVLQNGLAAIQGLHAAILHNAGVKDPSHKLSPSQVAAESFFGPMQESRQTGPFNQLWGIGTKAAVSNDTYEKVRAVTQSNLAQLLKAGAESVKSGGTRLVGNAPTPQGVTGTIPNLANTRFVPVYQAAQQLNRQLLPLQQQYHLLSLQQQELTTNPIYADPRYKMTIGNQLTRQQAELNTQMLGAIRSKEAELGKVIPGFTFDKWQEVVK